MNVKIKGKIIDCYKKPIYINKETGETSPERFALQLLSNQVLNNGDSRKELIDITIDGDQINKYQQNIGKDVEVNCKLYSKSGISLTAI